MSNMPSYIDRLFRNDKGFTVCAVETAGLEESLQAMRLSYTQKRITTFEEDLRLARRLISEGTSNRKFMRLIDVWAEIRAPRYWWLQFDTYRIGVDGCSESTMHTIMSRSFRAEDFTRPDGELSSSMWLHIGSLEAHRKEGLFDGVIEMLPQSYLQTRIVKMSYEALRKMYVERRHHKLSEWHTFCDWIKSLDVHDLICHGIED